MQWNCTLEYLTCAHRNIAEIPAMIRIRGVAPRPVFSTSCHILIATVIIRLFKATHMHVRLQVKHVHIDMVTCEDLAKR